MLRAAPNRAWRRILHPSRRRPARGARGRTALLRNCRPDRERVRQTRARAQSGSRTRPPGQRGRRGRRAAGRADPARETSRGQSGYVYRTGGSYRNVELLMIRIYRKKLHLEGPRKASRKAPPRETRTLLRTAREHAPLAARTPRHTCAAPRVKLSRRSLPRNGSPFQLSAPKRRCRRAARPASQLAACLFDCGCAVRLFVPLRSGTCCKGHIHIRQCSGTLGRPPAPGGGRGEEVVGGGGGAARTVRGRVGDGPRARETPDAHLAALAATIAVPRATIAGIRAPRVRGSKTVRECLWAAAAAIAHSQVHGEAHDIVCSHPAVLLQRGEGVEARVAPTAQVWLECDFLDRPRA